MYIQVPVTATHRENKKFVELEVLNFTKLNRVKEIVRTQQQKKSKSQQAGIPNSLCFHSFPYVYIYIYIYRWTSRCA